jgi:hypothetical protein
MNQQKQSQLHSFAETDSGKLFRAQVIAAMPTIPVVIPRPHVDSFGRQIAVRTPHWLSRFVASPIASVVPPTVNQAAERAANNFATWSSYLPKACVDRMVALGWDRTT